MESLDLSAFSLDKLPELFEDFDPDFSLPLIIGLSTGLGVLFLILLVLTVYFSFFSNSSVFLGSNFNIPGEFDDEENRLYEERSFIPKLDSRNQENYTSGRDFELSHTPITNPLGTSLVKEERQLISDRGIQAYMFAQDEEYFENSNITPSAIIEDKLDVRFISDDPNSAILNYPLPVNNEKDCVYFEVKIFEMSPNSRISIGLTTRPYPLFRLPGYHKYSIAYESSGSVRINQPFECPEIWDKLVEGDVLGVGFKARSGSIFFTHNGKKVLDAVHNVKLDLYPIIGSKGSSKLDVNLGQLGFVFIEANVKKWGFGSVFGAIGIPPAYGKEIVNDQVLDKGEELPPNYPSEEETFFGPSALLERQGTEPRIKPSKIISSPPSYTDEPKSEMDNGSNDNDDIVPGDPEVSNEITEGLYERRSSIYDQQNNDYDPFKAASSIENKPNDIPSQSQSLPQSLPRSDQSVDESTTPSYSSTRESSTDPEETVSNLNSNSNSSSSVTAKKNKKKNKKKSKKKSKK